MKTLKNINNILKNSGIDLPHLIRSLRGIPFFLKNYRAIKNDFNGNMNLFAKGSFMPCLSDRFAQSGTISEHYFNQDLFVAQKIFVNKPEKHVDIGSRIDGFVAHVASFREIEVMDIREMHKNISNVKFMQSDLMSDGFNLFDYCDSVSSLHAIEHFGLGRYGDNPDYFGYKKGLDNIYRMLKKKGTFYFSVPLGEQRIEFDAHRVFSLPYLVGLFEEKYEICSFSYIDDFDNLHKNIRIDKGSPEFANSFNCNFGCAIFELIKK